MGGHVRAGPGRLTGKVLLQHVAELIHSQVVIFGLDDLRRWTRKSHHPTPILSFFDGIVDSHVRAYRVVLWFRLALLPDLLCAHHSRRPQPSPDLFVLLQTLLLLRLTCANFALWSDPSPSLLDDAVAMNLRQLVHRRGSALTVSGGDVRWIPSG